MVLAVEDRKEMFGKWQEECFFSDELSGSFNAAPPHPPALLPRMKNKTTKTRSAWGGEVANLSKEKGLDPFPPWAFIRFIGIGMQINSSIIVSQ